MVNGKLIAAVAMPGSGKSTLLREVSQLIQGSKIFIEAEPSPEDLAVELRDEMGDCGPFTTLTWYRSQRVPELFKARKMADEGAIVFVDTYYDKLCSLYIDMPEMSWLIPNFNPYYSYFKSVSELDQKYLPDVDVIVTIEVEKSDWQRMVNGRNRALDKKVGLLNSFDTQQAYFNAAAEYCQKSGVPRIHYKNVFGDEKKNAAELLASLKMNGVL